MSVMALQLVLDVILKENGQPKFCSFLGVGLHCHQPKLIFWQFWGWVHHKFRENNKEPLKEARPGNSYFLSAHQSLDSQDAYPTACAGPRYNTGVRKQLNLFQDRSFAGPMENTEEIFKDHRNSDFFHGFLAIGTLGGETLLDEPATPTFGMSSEDPGKDYADVTENDLKLISNELEKFLEAEAKEGHNQPAGRNSDTNTIASTIEAIEALDAEEDSQPMKFPLQEYLFGSLIELPETKIADKKERASLGDLFRKTEMQDTQPETKYGKKNNQTSSTHKSAKHLVKKVLKKLHPSSRSSASGKTEVASKKKKFQKMVQVFHRKVHPEDSMMESEIYSRMENPKYSEASSIGLMSENPCNETSKRWIQYELRNSRSASNGEQLGFRHAQVPCL